MQIFNFKQVKCDLIGIIDDFTTEDNKGFMEDLIISVEENDISDNQLSVAYYMASIMKKREQLRNPVTDIKSRSALDTNTFDYPDMKFANLQQDLYTTLLLSKPNGIEFLKGSTDITYEEYIEMHRRLISEFISTADYASAILGLDLLQAV